MSFEYLPYAYFGLRKMHDVSTLKWAIDKIIHEFRDWMIWYITGVLTICTQVTMWFYASVVLWNKLLHNDRETVNLWLFLRPQSYFNIGLNDLSFSTENRDLKHYDFGIVKAAFFLVFFYFTKVQLFWCWWAIEASLLKKEGSLFIWLFWLLFLRYLNKQSCIWNLLPAVFIIALP